MIILSKNWEGTFKEGALNHFSSSAQDFRIYFNHEMSCTFNDILFVLLQVMWKITCEK